MVDKLSAELVLGIGDARKQVEAIRKDVEKQLDAATKLSITADASQVTRSVDRSIDAADTEVAVTGDASDVTGSVTGAVDAADTDVAVTADASDVTGSVTGAVEAADSAVTVTGEAGSVTGAIDAAVAAADKNVALSVESSGLQESIVASQVLGETLGNVAQQGQSAGLATAAGAEAAGSTLAHATTSGQGLVTVLGSARNVLGTLGIGLGGAAVLSFLKDSTDAASDLNESVSKSEQVFGSSQQTIMSWAETSSRSVLLSKQAAVESAASFGNLFTAMGLGKQAAADTSIGVVQLGADLASFNNLGVDETLLKIRSGLVGEVEPLRTLGISFNAAQVEAKGMQLGLADANGELSDGAKIQARWALISEQSATATGDVARTFEGLANQSRFMQAELGNARAELGAKLLPVVLEMTKAGIPLAQALVAVAQQLARGLIPAVRAAVPLAQLFAEALGIVADILEAIPTPVLTSVAAFVALRSMLGPFDKLLQGVASGLTNVAYQFPKMQSAGIGAAGGVATLSGFLDQNRNKLFGAAAAGLVAVQSFDQIGKSAEGTAMGVGSLALAGFQIGSMFGGMGGPIGAAAGAVVGLGAAMFSGGESVEDYREKFAKLGAELADLSRMESVRKFVDQLGETDKASAALDQLDGKVANTVRSFTQLNQTTYTTETVTKKVQANARAITDEIEALASKSPGAADRVVQGLSKIRDETGKPLFTGQEFDLLVAAAEKGTVAYGKKAVAAQQAQAVDQQVAEAATSTATAYDLASKAADDYRESLEQLDAGHTSAFAAETQFEESFVSLTAALAASSGQFDVNSEKSLAARAALSSSADAARDYSAQIIASGGSQEAARVPLVNLTNALTDQLSAFGRSPADIAQLLNSLGLVSFASPEVQAAAAAMGISVEGVGASAQTAAATTADGMAKAKGAIDGSGIPGAAGAQAQGAVDEFGNPIKAGLPAAIDSGVEMGRAAFDRGALKEHARGVGHATGRAFGEGLEDGILARAGDIASAAAQVVRDAEDAARREARSHSPSLLFADLGKDLGRGMALGLASSEPAVIDAAGNLVAVSAAAPTPPSGSGIGGNVLVNIGGISVTTDGSAADARRAAKIIAREVSGGLTSALTKQRANVAARS